MSVFSLRVGTYAYISVPKRGIASPKVVAPKRHGPEFSAEKTWARLSHNIREILNHRAFTLSFEENHRFAYNMVLYKCGDMLYKGLQQIVIENLNKLVAEKIQPTFPTSSADEDVVSAEEEALLKAVKQVWDDHEKGMTRLGSVLRYMDRVHTQDARVPTTAELIPLLFIQHVMTDRTKERIVSAILHQIQHERDGSSINRSAVKEVVHVFLILDADRSHTRLYTKDVEPRLLEETRNFYRKEGQRLLQECNASQYLSLTEARFQAEDQRAHHYLSSTTAGPLANILKEELLAPNLGVVMLLEQSGLDGMIDNNRTEDLQRLYRLCSMIPSGIKALRDNLKATLVQRGKVINENSEPTLQEEEENEAGSSKKPKNRAASQDLQVAVNWVQAVLALKDKFDTIWKDDFQCHREIETSIIEGFESFVNANKKSPEYISLFIDDHLKRGFKGANEEVEVILAKTISLFRYLAEKDVFERYYKNHLAKRLLHGKSVNDDAERGMLAKFKVECGVQFTRKMEGMFRDIKVSEDITQEYHDYIKNTTAPELEIGVIVMTSNCWPISHSSSSGGHLPALMAQATKSFEKFYHTKHSGRCLSWQLSLGNADIKATFGTKTHELNVSTFALVILLLFSELGAEEKLSYKEILQATGIEEVELKRHLQSLACAKYKILVKHPSGREIDLEDSFSFNDKFSAPQYKIKVGTVSSKVENPEQTRETRERIDEERKHQIDACIVRIMKSRQHMTHQALVSEVVTQLGVKFKPAPTDIKKRIESLIEREYLERSEDKKSYTYQA